MWYFSILFLFSLHAMAAPDCHLYEVKGHVLRSGDDVRLVVNQDTRKESRLKVSPQALPAFIPYLKLTVKGKFIIRSPVQRDALILRTIGIEGAIPDPLNQGSHSYMKDLKEVPCPSN